MAKFHEQYLVDEEGNRKAVVVPIAEWEHVLELLEEIEDIWAYDESKREDSEAIPFERAVSEIHEGKPD